MAKANMLAALMMVWALGQPHSTLIVRASEHWLVSGRACLGHLVIADIDVLQALVMVGASAIAS